MDGEILIVEIGNPVLQAGGDIAIGHQVEAPVAPGFVGGLGDAARSIARVDDVIAIAAAEDILAGSAEHPIIPPFAGGDVRALSANADVLAFSA